MKVEVRNGLNDRPAAQLVQVASRFDSSVYIEYDNKKINAKSIMGMLTLKLDEGADISITADGADENDAISSIQSYLTAGK